MSLILDGSNGITTPMYNGSVASNTVTPSVNMKNRIINGAMVIDQRNAGASVTPTSDSTYTLDRWVSRLSVASKYSVQQNAGSVTPPTGFSNYLGVTSLSAYTVGASEYFQQQHRIEGFNVADLNWGTANAKTITISFWVRSSLTGSFGASLTNNDASRWYPFSYTISSANTWTQISVTIAGDTTGTWTTTNTTGLQINFGLGVGSTYSGGGNAWTSSVYIVPASSVSVVGTNGATFYITGVQLEVGSSATSFDYRPYGTELSLCQRYYWKQTYQQANTRFGTGIGLGDTTIDGLLINLPVPMRTVPTNAVNAIGVYDGTSAKNITALNTSYSSPVLFAQQATADATTTAGKVVQIYATGSTAYVSSSAEL